VAFDQLRGLTRPAELAFACAARLYGGRMRESSGVGID
jgi:hypothetical protein